MFSSEFLYLFSQKKLDFFHSDSCSSKWAFSYLRCVFSLVRFWMKGSQSTQGGLLHMVQTEKDWIKWWTWLWMSIWLAPFQEQNLDSKNVKTNILRTWTVQIMRTAAVQQHGQGEVNLCHFRWWKTVLHQECMWFDVFSIYFFELKLKHVFLFNFADLCCNWGCDSVPHWISKVLQVPQLYS